MTRRQLGGPCDLELTGARAPDVIKAQDRHLREAVTAGDATREQALQEIRPRRRHPVRAMGWYRGVKRTSAELVESRASASAVLLLHHGVRR